MTWLIVYFAFCWLDHIESLQTGKLGIFLPFTSRYARVFQDFRVLFLELYLVGSMFSYSWGPQQPLPEAPSSHNQSARATFLYRVFSQCLFSPHTTFEAAPSVERRAHRWMGIHVPTLVSASALCFVSLLLRGILSLHLPPLIGGERVSAWQLRPRRDASLSYLALLRDLSVRFFTARLGNYGLAGTGFLFLFPSI